MHSFLDQALVFIGASVILVPLFQRLGLGSVLGYLIAGICVGPYGLGFIQDTESVSHLSELGVVLLLFMIGLEIQPRKLWSMRHSLLRFGGVQVLFCTSVFMVLGYAFGLPLPVAGVLGFALSLSSTAFAVQSLNEQGQFNTEFGRSSFSILLMQDMIAIPALALIPALGFTSVQSVSTTPLERTTLAVLLVLGLVIASRLLLRPLFRYLASTRSSEVFTAASLLIVLGVAALMQKIGLSTALGTFIAGVLLADSEYRHELETNLEPFKGLLMGLFFIAVGMSVSLDLITERPLFMVTLASGYLFIKAVLIYGVGRLSQLNHLNSKRMALCTAQGGEFAFVIFGIVAQSTGTVSAPASETVPLLTAMITLSMALNPIASRVNDWLERKQTARIQPVYDTIADESPEVLLAGFGRFGQIFARIFRAQGISFVAIDHDSDQVELARKFGNKVYYGDASRKALLETAGADKAKYFILAIDDVEISLKTAKLVLAHFPHLKIFARARNRGHAFDLMDLGIKEIKRETLDSSINFVGDLLVERGMARDKATWLIERFRTHDEIMLQDQAKVRLDDKTFVSLSKQATAQLAQVLSGDSSTPLQ